MIVLHSSDDKTFVLREAVALRSKTIKQMIEDSRVDDCITLHDVNSEVLIKVIDYIEHHVDAAEKLKAFDADFVKVDTSMLLDLIWAANYLDVKSLLNLMCHTARNSIEGKTPDEIRMILDLVNDFTPQEKCLSRDTTSSQKMIILKSSDNKTFEVTEQVAAQSQTIKHMIEDNCVDNCIPLPNVTSDVLAKVIEYNECHVDAVEKLKAFDAEFVEVDLNMLFDLFMAAQYLHIESLQELTGQTIRNIKGDKILILVPDC